MRKRVSRTTAGSFPWYLRLYGVMLGAAIPGKYHRPGSLRGFSREQRFGGFTLADLVSLTLTGNKPSSAETRLLQMLIGLLISNGPGSISAQGAKGAVSADGPRPRAACRSTRAWSAS